MANEPDPPAPTPPEGENTPPAQGPSSKKGAKAVGSSKDLPPKKAPAKKGDNLRSVPDDKRCEHMIEEEGKKPYRCKRYRGKRVGGGLYDWCPTHLLAHGGPLMQGTKTAEETKDLLDVLSRPVFDPKNPPMTQDEISRGRALIVLKLEHKSITPDVANAMLRALKEQSEHIEMYGGEQGAEGGSKVLRVMPGVTIIEQHDPSTVPLTMEEVKLILEGQEDDRANGVTPPESFAECVVRYVGRPRAATTVYDKHQDPEGVREYEEGGARVVSFAETEQRARARWKRLREEQKRKAQKPKAEG